MKLYLLTYNSLSFGEAWAEVLKERLLVMSKTTLCVFVSVFFTHTVYSQLGSNIDGSLSGGTTTLDGGNTTINTTITNTEIITSLNACIWDSYDFTSECMDEITLVTGYEFFIDDETGNLMYGDPSNKCSATKLSCIQFCNNYEPENIITANASEFTTENDLDEDLEENFEISSNDNPFVKK